MFKILLATHNKHKVTEFKAMLDAINLPVELLTLDDIETDIPETDEDQDTFQGNAEKKALEASLATGLPVIADDSGLEVDALNGAPGIHSSRYAGENATDAERMEKLLNALNGHENRNARFVCHIAIAFNEEIIGNFEGVVDGTIVDAPRGDSGFGYDPIFQPNGYDKTFGELGADIKDTISHRANALKNLQEFVEDELSALGDFELI